MLKEQLNIHLNQNVALLSWAHWIAWGQCFSIPGSAGESGASKYLTSSQWSLFSKGYVCRMGGGKVFLSEQSSSMEKPSEIQVVWYINSSYWHCPNLLLQLLIPHVTWVKTKLFCFPFAQTSFLSPPLKYFSSQRLDRETRHSRWRQKQPLWTRQISSNHFKSQWSINIWILIYIVT